MIKISQCKIQVNMEVNKTTSEDSEKIRRNRVAKVLHSNPSDIIYCKIIKKSIDAREKPCLFYVYSFLVEIKDEKRVLEKCCKDKNVAKYVPGTDFKENLIFSKSADRKSGYSIVIVGAGPAGLFAAYTLVLAGQKPIVIERGEKIEERITTIEKFWNDGILDENSNIAFGEGGAGTFSDGKLNTGVKDKSGRLRFILETFVRFGAPEEILYDAKPHIGTDKLRHVIIRMRKEIESLGGKFHFRTTLEHTKMKQGKICEVVVKDNLTGKMSPVFCEKCILAIGHSARDTYRTLYEEGFEMEAKAFAVGVRVEHLQKMVDESQYGKKEFNLEKWGLPAADYKLTARTKEGRGVYSFCMCPGGFVINASSTKGKLVVNGMSNHDRSEKNANSAIIVNVTPDDFENKSPLAGISFQETIEKQAWNVGEGKIPVQIYKDFKKNLSSMGFGDVTPNTKGGTILNNVRNILPKFIGDAIEEAMPQFARKMKGFDRDDTLILGVETRTSAPVRIVRTDSMQSGCKNVYPCGEGAGYAGGIMSAAMDGCKVAIHVMED